MSLRGRRLRALLLPILAPIAAPIAALLALAPAAAAPVSEYDLKAAYIFHFLQFTEWPRAQPAQAPELTLCVDPDNPLLPALRALQNRNAGARAVVLKPEPWTIRDRCAALLVTRGDQSAINRNLLAAAHTLTISDDPAVTLADAIILLRVDRGRLVFSINNTQAQSFGLTISSRLLRLAESVQ